MIASMAAAKEKEKRHSVRAEGEANHTNTARHLKIDEERGEKEAEDELEHRAQTIHEGYIHFLLDIR